MLFDKKKSIANKKEWSDSFEGLFGVIGYGLGYAILAVIVIFALWFFYVFFIKINF